MPKITQLTSLCSQRLPHALLIASPDFTQLTHQLSPFLQQLLCPSQGCGYCQICGWINARTHPDIVWLPLLSQNFIKMEDIRDLMMHMQQSAHQGNYKIGILAPTEAMAPNAHHALLKTLEEPPAHSLFILLSQYPHMLPATLRSRCQQWTFTVDKSIEPNAWLALLKQTLMALQQHKISPFTAAAEWQHKASLNEILTASYEFVFEYSQLSSLDKKTSQAIFMWVDEINSLRRQVWQKGNPNTLITLEYLFWRWQQGVSG